MNPDHPISRSPDFRSPDFPITRFPDDASLPPVHPKI
jgi:hypothetical protein